MDLGRVRRPKETSSLVREAQKGVQEPEAVCCGGEGWPMRVRIATVKGDGDVGCEGGPGGAQATNGKGTGERHGRPWLRGLQSSLEGRRRWEGWRGRL